MKQLIYLDYAATTPLDSAVAKAMEPYWSKQFGNASSVHHFGQKAAEAVSKARQQIADFLHCQSNEVIFTSGATEANNLAIKGVVEQPLKRGDHPHIIISAIEHPAVLEVAEYLSTWGVKVTKVKAESDGQVKVKNIIKAITPQTVLISLMYVNNETGVIQLVGEVGEELKKLNQYRAEQGLPKILFHTDAVQAAPWLSCDVSQLGVDLLSLSAHKIYGPKGVGALYIRSGVTLVPQLYGGHQQNSLRPGTLPVSLIVGLGKAASLLTFNYQNNQSTKVKKLRDRLLIGLQKTGFVLTGRPSQLVPGHIHGYWPRINGEVILTALDLVGIAVSTGAACSAGAQLSSTILRGMGWTAARARLAVRFSLGKFTTTPQINTTLKAASNILIKIRKS